MRSRPPPAADPFSLSFQAEISGSGNLVNRALVDFGFQEEMIFHRIEIGLVSKMSISKIGTRR